MKVGALFSGGKDSTYAAWLASSRDELSCLITIFPRSDSSYMFHYPDLDWTGLQAESMGVPQLKETTEGVKEDELEDLKRALARAKDEHDIGGVYTGALASVYQKSRVERLCAGLGLKCFSPLWGVDPSDHLQRIVREGFETIITSVSALGLQEDWLGRTLNADAVEELLFLAKKYRFHAGLEGGEGETFVLDCPAFSQRIEVVGSIRHWKGVRGFYEITDARLVPKPSLRAGPP